MKILVADDDEDTRVILTTALTAGGHEVVTVRNGCKGLEMARRWRPDLIIADVLMPEMDGYTLRRALNEDPALGRIPFVFYSGTFVEEDDVRLAGDLGAARFVEKPVDPDALLELVAEVAAEAAGDGHTRPPQEGADIAERVESRLSAKLYKKYRQVGEQRHLLEEQEITLRGIVAALPDILFTLEPESLVPTYVSPVVETLMGYRPEELQGQAEAWRAMVHPDDLGQVVEMLRRAGEEGMAMMEGRMRGRADEDYRWFEVRVAAVRGEMGRPLKLAGVLREITERKEAEHRLQQAQKMEAVGNLTGGVAHDFNNLLGVVLGNLQLIERLLEGGDGADERVAARLEAAMEAVHRGADLSRRLLAFSRRQLLEPRVIDLNQLVAGMDLLLSRSLGESVTVRVSAAPDLWPVSVDPGQVETALLNLAVNARDAMPDGGILTIETANVTLDERYTAEHEYGEPGDYAMLAVTDTGTGMDADLLSRVFEPFFTTKEAGKGTGLGLSMVYGFVKQSDGMVNIYSEEGLGTTVKLYFPRADADAEPLAEERKGREVQPGGGEAVLVVEDDAALRDTVAEYLRTLGYRVIEAGNGAEALEALAADPEIALVFTDLVMPGGMNGAQLATEACRRVPGLRVLFTSGYVRDTLGSEDLARLEADILAKPFRLEELARRVRETLDEGEAPPRGDRET